MKSHLTKEEIAKIPIQASFDGEITVIESEEEAIEVLNLLSQEQEVGFDTETRPSFTRGENHEVALIQLATQEKAYLFRTCLIAIPNALAHFLENANILKIGLSLQDDFRAMRKKRSGLKLEGFVDLQKITPAYGIKDLGLRNIYAILFGERISKQARLTNWEMDTLSDKAIQYAALDAYACLRIYQRLLQLPIPKVHQFGLLYG